MKINDILKEEIIDESDIEYYKELIKDSEFFKNNQEAIMEHDIFLNHGSERNVGKVNLIELKDRESSKDTAESIHNIVNEISKEEFGVALRNKLFVSSNHKLAEQYGDRVYKIFPLGKYKIYYSKKVEDLYSEMVKVVDFFELERKIIERVFKEILKRKELSQISKLVKSNFSQILENNFDDLKAEIVFPSDVIYKSLTSDSHLNELSRILYKKFKRNILDILDDNTNIDDIGEQINTTLDKMLDNLLDDIDEDIRNIINDHIRNSIRQNYINDIESTQYIADLEHYTEGMLDAEKAIFISPVVLASVLEQIRLEYED